MKSTLSFYDNNADAYFDETYSLDMSAHYAKFEAYLPTQAAVLDCGCGSGRDSRHFLTKHYRVVAIDGSEELCKKAELATGLKVRQMLFQDICFENEFDGIWACASLLHVPKAELPEVFGKLRDALKDSGALYASFKYGDFEGEINGRYFTYLTEESAGELLAGIQGLRTAEAWITGDARESRASEKWLNVIVVKAEAS